MLLADVPGDLAVILAGAIAAIWVALVAAIRALWQRNVAQAEARVVLLERALAGLNDATTAVKQNTVAVFDLAGRVDRLAALHGKDRRQTPGGREGGAERR